MSEIKKYQRNADILVTEMDGSLMMMSIEVGKYFELNPVSKRIWELFETPNSIEEVVEVLLTEYEISKEDCEKEVITHVDTLIDEKIILEI